MDIKSRYVNQDSLGISAIHTGKLLLRAFEVQFSEDRHLSVSDEVQQLERLRVIRELQGFGGTEETTNAILTVFPEIARRAEACASTFTPDSFQVMSDVFRYDERYAPGVSLTLQAVVGSELRTKYYVTITALALSTRPAFTEEMLDKLVSGFEPTKGFLAPVDLSEETDLIEKHAELLATADDNHMRLLTGLAGQPPRPYQGLESFFLVDGFPIQITTRFYYNPEQVAIYGSAKCDPEYLYR